MLAASLTRATMAGSGAVGPAGLGVFLSEHGRLLGLPGEVVDHGDDGFVEGLAIAHRESEAPRPGQPQVLDLLESVVAGRSAHSRLEETSAEFSSPYAHKTYAQRMASSASRICIADVGVCCGVTCVNVPSMAMRMPVDGSACASATRFGVPSALNARLPIISPSLSGVKYRDVLSSYSMRAMTLSAPMSRSSGKARIDGANLLLYASTSADHWPGSKLVGTLSGRSATCCGDAAGAGFVVTATGARARAL